MAALVMTRAMTEVIGGDFVEARRMMSSLPKSPVSFDWWSAIIETQVSLGLHDLMGARKALALAEQRAVHGPRIDATRDLLRAGISALDGRPEEALDQFDTAIGSFRSLGSVLDLVFALMHRADLTDGLDGASAAADEARAILGQLGATGTLAAFEERLAARRDQTSRVAAGEAAAQPETPSPVVQNG